MITSKVIIITKRNFKNCKQLNMSTTLYPVIGIKCVFFRDYASKNNNKKPSLTRKAQSLRLMRNLKEHKQIKLVLS